MNVIKANTVNELHKLLAKRGTKAMLVLVGLSPLLILLFMNFFKNGIISIPDSNIQFLIIAFLSTVLLPLFVMVNSADMYQGEMERKTMKLLFTRPISRGEIFLSKTVAITIMIGVQLGLVWLVATISTAVLGEDGTLSRILSSFVAYTVSLIPLIALTAFSVFVVQWFKSSTMAITILITSYMAMKAAVFLFPALMYALPVAYSDWYLRFLGHSSLLWISQSFLYLLSFSALFFTLGYYMFNRKEN